MRKSLVLYALLMCLFLGFNSSVFAQEASLGHIAKSLVMNPDDECTGTGELVYDDNTFENGYGWNNTATDGQIVMLFTPESYPWQFNTVCIAFSRVAAGPSSFNFDVVVYDNNGTSGEPGDLVTSISGLVADNIPIWPSVAWYSYDISSLPELSTGSYYIGTDWDASTLSGLVAIGADESATTPLHPGYAQSNYGAWSGNEILWPDYKAMAIRTLGDLAGGPGAAINPSPVAGALDVSIDADLSWENPSGVTNVEVFFGTDASNLTSVYSGAPITNWTLATLDYYTTYYWRIVETDGSGTSTGPIWSFRTEQNPLLVTEQIFFDDFENGTGLWTITNDGGTCVWDIFSDAAITGRYTMPANATGGIFSADADHCGSGSTILSTATITQIFDLSLYTTSVSVEFDNDWYIIDSDDQAHVEVSIDGGTTWVGVWDYAGVGVRNSHESIDVTSLAAGHSNVQFRIRTIQPGYDWWWSIDNFTINGQYVTPVELTSFRADVNNGNVVLNWATASETNNKGFEVQKNSGNGYQVISFVQGNGTSTKMHSYSFVDNSVASGKYSYRLKQVDFDGAISYSNVAEVSVVSPKMYSLQQNYPNPFNPTTRINFSLAADSKVTLQIFDILGQQIKTLLNGNMTTGEHNVTFDASHLNSGVYLYKIEAVGIDGSSFTSVKKMILTK